MFLNWRGALDPDYPHGSPLDPFQKLHIIPLLRAPGLNAVLQLGLHEGRVEADNPLPHTAGYPSADAAISYFLHLIAEASA